MPDKKENKETTREDVRKQAEKSVPGENKPGNVRDITPEGAKAGSSSSGEETEESG